MRPKKKRTQYLQLNVVEAQRCFAASGTGCINCVQGIMKSGDYQKILACYVGPSVRGHGCSSRTMTKNIPQKAPRNGWRLLQQ